MRQLFVIMMLSMLAGQAMAARAEAANDNAAAEAGYGAGSVLGTLVYAPFKATFCILGALGSGVTLAAAGPDQAGRVATASCGGTWVITPDVVKGRQEVHFVGGTSGPARTAVGRAGR